MSIFTGLKMIWQKRKLGKRFHPLGMRKRRTFVVSVPAASEQVMDTLSFLDGLKAWGQVIVLVPSCIHYIYTWLSKRYFTELVYPKPARRFGKEMTSLQQQLADREIHFLIELNKPVNLSLPFLTNAEKRMCFFDGANFPYYNIMMKDGYISLHEFFSIRKSDPVKAISYAKRTKSQMRKAYGRRKPLCLVNGTVPATWSGDTIILGKDIPRTHPDVLCLLYCADAYSGAQDILYEFARAYKKEIIPT
jgi:hypothetical protein